MEDEPHPIWDYQLGFMQSPWLELGFKFFLLFSLLFLSGIVSGIETAFEASLSGKKSKDSKKLNSIINKPFEDLKSTFAIFQFLLRTGAGITLAEVFRSILNITNIHLFYALLFCMVSLMLVYGQWVTVLIPRNNKLQENISVRYVLLFLVLCLSPFSKALSKLKKISRNQLKRKGYLEKEKKTERKHEVDLDKVLENFNLTTVKQVMRSRIDITAFNIELDFDELLENLKTHGFSRIPVFRDTIDKIEGILYLKDLLPYIGRGKDFHWQNLLRPPYFVPENKRIEELLKEFQEKHVHMALVVDGYGGISGLITLEDILEEIVGEINDELDEVDLNFIRLDENSYIFEGKTSLTDFCRIVGVDSDLFDEVKGENESLGGLLLQMNSNLPKKGDKIYYKNFVFRIDSANNKRIKKIHVDIFQEKEVNQDAER